MYSSYHLTKGTVRLFYDDMLKRKLAWLHGYPSHIAMLSALIIDEGLEPMCSIKWVTTGAEGLVGNQIVMIQKAFPNAVIRSHYGQNEGVAIMNQDGNGDWYVEEDFSYVEFIPLERNRNICRIVGTGFFNSAFPLIRYDTGDLATVERNEDGTIKRIVSIDGRTSNTIKQKSGHEITEAALSIVLHDFDNIKEAQFHQVSKEEIVLWVVRGSKYSEEDELKLKKALSQAFDKGMLIKLKYVDRVERTKAGKLRLVVTEMK
jgi:phenylacetate-CoA ligase